MADIDWRNVLLAGARGLQYTFAAIALALSGKVPTEVLDFSHDAEPSQSGVTGRKKRAKKEKRAPSAYNLFVAEQTKLRKAERPEIPHSEHFKLAAQDWKNSSKNKKNAPSVSEAPAMTEDLHQKDFEDEEAEGLLEVTSQGVDDEADAEVTGPLGSPAREAEERERAEKKDKKKRKKERPGDAQESGGAAHHQDVEEGAADKRSSKKSKR